ncbi:tRNA glutamyl-Q(34) synthetase GluQRS [Methylophaga sp. OBS3]|uniref:tRNA glutamyl-Q(34) synthetase GluQRS n=1 Tax=Methylophaga sp. OBS3 TaxID=2991934 RepID=UPI00225354D6|nr:tRNA glutamyl-Q(34) synthetase GluQRS [Methylophaga sp. OBS3]MCX4188798.1 tRNA glutamyl-Q(34) synthetase GluQRS [Methylophaga sp. OBS3]
MKQTLKSDLYIGRFAPSPTGPLHFGSLLTATASYLDAKAHQGIWLVRMEDLDKPREVQGAADDILRTLNAFGLAWDREVIYQSQHLSRYQAILDELCQQCLVYPCGCSRKEIADIAKTGHEGLIYPGTCRNGLAGKSARAWRCHVPNQTITIEDRIQQTISQNLEREVGDFVLRRADGIFAYQLAVVIDDAWQNITDIVRGVDLLLSTPRQVLLQQLLGYSQPRYAHLPVITDQQGQKLSKQNRAEPIRAEDKGKVICQVLTLLGMQTPDDLYSASLPDIWQWAIDNWSINQIPKKQTLPVTLITE